MGTVSFLLFIELKGTEIGIVIMFKVLCLWVLLGLTQANDMKMVKKWAKKIAQHHFMTSCVGEKTMMKMWKKVEETADECLQLEPAFDIPLFEGDDGDMLDDNDINPFITSNQGFQTLPSQVTNRFAQAPQQFAGPPGTTLGCTIPINSTEGTKDKLLLPSDTSVLLTLQLLLNLKNSSKKSQRLK